MKKIIVGLMILALFMVWNTVYAAEDLTGKVSIGIVAGGAFPTDEDIDNALYLGGNIAYSFNNYFAIGAEIGYSSWEDEAYGIDFGDVRVVPLLMDFYIRHPIDMGEHMLLPYGVFGIGPVFYNYDESSFLEAYGIEVDMSTELGIKLGGGFDLFVSDNVALNFETSYLMSDVDMTVPALGASGELDTDSWIINGGVKFYF